MNKHLHIGTGSLGLGLTCWATHVAGMRVYLANRSSQDADKRKELIEATGAYQIELPNGDDDVEVNVAGVFSTDTQISDVLAIAVDPQLILMTTALKEAGLRAQMDNISKVLDARINTPGLPQLFVVACENAVDSNVLRSWFVEKSSFDTSIIDERIVFLPCVVDRMCNKPTLENGKLVYVCEKYARWHILKSERSQGLQDVLSGINSSVVFDSNIESLIARKKYTVNAAHLLVSIYAHYNDQSEVHEFVRSTAGAQILEGILEEVTWVFDHWCGNNGRPFQIQQIHMHVAELRVRMQRHPQLVRDGVTRLKKVELEEFLTDYHRKIGESCIAFELACGDPLFYMPLGLCLVSELVKEKRYVQ